MTPNITLLPDPVERKLPEFDTLAEAAQFLHDSFKGLYSLDSFGGTKVDVSLGMPVEPEYDRISFGGVAVFHALRIYGTKGTGAIRYNSPEIAWRSGEYDVAADALGVTPAEIVGFAFAMDNLALGMELRSVRLILTKEPPFGGEDYPIDLGDIARETHTFCKSLLEFVAILGGVN